MAKRKKTASKKNLKTAPGKARIRAKTAKHKKTSAKKRKTAAKPCWWALPVSCLMLILLSEELEALLQAAGKLQWRGGK